MRFYVYDEKLIHIKKLVLFITEKERTPREVLIP